MGTDKDLSTHPGPSPSVVDKKIILNVSHLLLKPKKVEKQECEEAILQNKAKASFFFFLETVQVCVETGR